VPELVLCDGSIVFVHVDCSGLSTIVIKKIVVAAWVSAVCF